MLVIQSQVSVLLVLAEYYRDRYQFSWCEQCTTETYISYVGVSRVLHRHVSVLLVLAGYYRDRFQFCWCKQRQVSVLIVLAEYYRVR